MNGMYEELIEKLRKNNRMSGWTHIDRLIDEAAEAIEALQQENEQLQAQVAQVREALEEATETIENIYEKDTPQTEKYRDILNNSGTYETLAEIDKAIGGKEDV